MSLYEQNLQALTAQNANLAVHLLSIEGNVDYEVFVDEKDPLKINLLHVKTNQVMYATDPLEEVLTKVEQFEEKFERYPILYFYGVGNGVLLKLLLQNELHKCIVVIEPEKEILYIALNLNDFQKEISENRLLFFDANEIDFPRSVAIFSHQDAKVFVKTYHLEIMQPFYEFNFGENILTCNRTFAQAIEHVIYGLGNDSSDALIGIEHHLANVSKMVESVTMNEFIQHAKTTDTAIIVSTGPSLKKQLGQLKKIKDQVTIFCIDASLPILEKENIKPDVVLSMERVYETAKFYQDTSKEFQEGIVFCLTSIVHPMLLESIKAGVLQMSMRPFGYTRYFDLEDYGYAGIGMSAANLAFEYIFHSKFKTCILIGQDLAYGEDGKSHSDGHLYGTDKKSHESDFFVTAYGGNGTVKTSKIWSMFKNFFETDLSHTNQAGLVTINATEGGARIEGTVEMPFVEACDQFVDRDVQKKPIEVHYPKPETIEHNQQKVKEKIDQMKTFASKVYDETEALFSDVADSCDALEKMDAYNNLENVDYDAIAALMTRIDDFKDYFDDDLFVNVFIDATQAMIVHQELELAKIQVRPIRNDDDKRRKMIDWIFAHRYWLFSLAGIIKAVDMAIARRGTMSHLVHKAKFDETSITCKFIDHKSVKKEHELVLEIDGTEVKRDITQNQNHTFHIPAHYFNDQFHTMVVKEAEHDIILLGMPQQEVLLSEKKHMASFIESLENIDEDRLKEVYTKDVIGFLATEENLEDEDFVNYIKELYVRFPQVTFKAFYFADEQKIQVENKLKNIQLIKVNNIFDLISNIQIYLTIHNGKDIIMNWLIRYCESIYVSPYSLWGKDLTLEQHDKQVIKNHKMINNLDTYGLLGKDFEDVNYSFNRLKYEKLLFKNTNLDEKNLNLNTAMYDFGNFDNIEYALADKQFINNIFRLRNINKRVK